MVSAFTHRSDDCRFVSSCRKRGINGILSTRYHYRKFFYILRRASQFNNKTSIVKYLDYSMLEKSLYSLIPNSVDLKLLLAFFCSSFALLTTEDEKTINKSILERRNVFLCQ